MDFLRLFDDIEKALVEGKKVPLTKSVVVDEAKISALIDKVKNSIPEEVKQARWIIKERDQMIAEAQKESSKIIEEARAKAASLASETEIVTLAERQAREVLEAAKAREREIRLGAEDYADEILANLEVQLNKLLTAVQRGRDRLQGKIESRV